MATTTTVSEQVYRDLALNDPDRTWELWHGALVEKPPMSRRHDDVAFFFGYQLQSQLDRAEYRVNVNGGKTRFSARNYYVPDVLVIPASLVRNDPFEFNAYSEPLPLVAEVWSPSTGDYDVAAKLPLYRQRGDREIWFLHHVDRIVTVSRKQPDGTYTEERYTSGVVPVLSLPGVTIDLDALLTM